MDFNHHGTRTGRWKGIMQNTSNNPKNKEVIDSLGPGLLYLEMVNGVVIQSILDLSVGSQSINDPITEDAEFEVVKTVLGK